MVVRNQCEVRPVMGTTEDLIAALEPILENFLLDEERNGEILIYTGLRETADGRLERVPEAG
jgi:hypothetical protein